MRKAIASIGILLGVVLGAWAQQASDLDLIRQLGGPDSRRASAELIRRGEAAVPALLTAATGSDTARAVRACQILGEIADSSALEPMLSLITNQGAQISDAAAVAADDIVNRGLQKLRDAIDQAPTKEDLDELRDAIVRVQDLRHILGMGRYTARVARECASNNPVIVRKLVSDVLSESGETDYRPLEDEELFVCGTGRWRPDEKAIEYVGQRCPDQLLEQLASSRCRFKAFVAEHLPPETLALASPYLLAMAVDPNPRRRLAAVEGLGSSPDLKAKDVLLAALKILIISFGRLPAVRCRSWAPRTAWMP